MDMTTTTFTSEITMSHERYNVKASKIKSGDLMAFIYWTRVRSVSGNVLEVEDLDNGNDPIRIYSKELIEKSFSADQYEKEEKVNKTRAAEILVHAANRPFTVSFQKTDGEERVLRGRLVKPEPLLGRSMVEDLDVSGVNRLRQVDHRTINYLIVDGVKYIVK